MVTSSEHRFISFDETPVFYRRIWSDGGKAAVIILHGMGEHGGRYVEAANFLAKNNMNVYLPDLRGFGLSGGRRAYARRFADFHQDLHALVKLAKSQNPNVPLFVLGHSFGGLIAASYAAVSVPREKIRGLILTSPLFEVAIAVPRWKKALGIALSRVLPFFTQATGIDPALLTHDASILKEYSKDRLINHTITASLYCQMQKALGSREQIEKKLSISTLLLQAGEDKIVSKAVNLGFFERLVSTDKELVVYEGYYHEILNEVSRQSVYSAINRWLSNHL